eukprot:CAMPEP_0119293206 /NCGR_PEP_ID=MMETSP1329-20130426/45639_1 /TAXON_ID=114041 /ORGANISM="Genus nov. species nov., Strain RCC1024" /LENGTH=53 /DNA_ID=CAMNT_0007294069 /DNA_START=132 /DNA_END=290 /DNA_ORIENTATION=+
MAFNFGGGAPPVTPGGAPTFSFGNAAATPAPAVNPLPGFAAPTPAGGAPAFNF